jgi:hypothetical protein
VFTLEVMNPVAGTQADQQTTTFEPAKRRGSLEDLTVGLIWNSKRGGELALDHTGRLLQGCYKNLRVIRYDGSMPCDKALLARARSECDVFVGSTGD